VTRQDSDAGASDKMSKEGSELVEAALGRPDRGTGGSAKGKSGGKEPTRGQDKGKSGGTVQAEARALGKRRREPGEEAWGAVGLVPGRLATDGVVGMTTAAEEQGPRVGDDAAARCPSASGGATTKEAAEGATTSTPPVTTVTRVPPQGVQRLSWLVSSGRTKARRRRQRRAEDALAVAKGILTREFREAQHERAKVLRVMMKRVISEMQEVTRDAPVGQKRLAVQKVIAVVRTAERRRPKLGRATPPGVSVRATRDEDPLETITEEEWQSRLQAYEQGAPQYLEETGSLAEMRATRRAAPKEAKNFRVARRARRPQLKRQQHEKATVATAATQQAMAQRSRRRQRAGYNYEKHGAFGDVELAEASDGRPQRKAQLRAAGSGALTSLPTALLAVSRKRTLEVRLDTCAQFSIAGDELRQYGRCLTRSAPVDIVEGKRAYWGSGSSQGQRSTSSG
jgi:hypothetical protein